MPEFTESDVKNWLQIAINHNCSIEKAIYYDVFFCSDDMKFTRAYRFFCHNMNLNPAGYLAEVRDRNEGEGTLLEAASSITIPE